MLKLIIERYLWKRRSNEINNKMNNGNSTDLSDNLCKDHNLCCDEHFKRINNLEFSLKINYLLIGLLILITCTQFLLHSTTIIRNDDIDKHIKVFYDKNISDVDENVLTKILINIIQQNNYSFVDKVNNDGNHVDNNKSTSLSNDYKLNQHNNGKESGDNDGRHNSDILYIQKNNSQQQQQQQQGIVLRRRRNAATSHQAEPLIEFFNPNYRKELDEQESEIRRRTGKSSATNGDDWVYLTSYCRVPEKTITGFCKGTQDYCPPSPPGPQGPFGPKGPTGPPGLPGVPGPKGIRGDVGLPGPSGLDGREGPVGPRGPKGDSGLPGSTGLDGRDGIPGEPGLDGVPGRAGADGIPGKDGKNGTSGRDGRDGTNGRDGLPGPKGAIGPIGERGPKGIPGARGKTGKSGVDGAPGIPGINAWKVKTNGTFSNELLIPPSIADTRVMNLTRSIIVEEGKTLVLKCAVNGVPLPNVEWRRADGRTMPGEREELSSISGNSLILSNITRNHMAAYTCYADNGIPPVANSTFLVEVHFSPMISVYRQIIYALEGGSASLECVVEAFPEAIRYWERVSDGKILDPGEKYRIETYPDGFKTTMRLTISNLNFMDFGQYFCVAKNELNSTIASFQVLKKDPALRMPDLQNEVKVFGSRPPERSCPPAPVCQECSTPSQLQCKDDITLNFDIKPTGNYSYPGLPRRDKTCVVYAVGKPVYHKYSDENYGAWLKDTAAKHADKDKIYETREYSGNTGNRLIEYGNKIDYRNNKLRKIFEIKEGFVGNTQVVYNGSLFFHQNNTDNIAKYDLRKEKVVNTAKLPYFGYLEGNTLYTTEHNFVDFNVDDVGLWIIYSTIQSNNTIVAKIDSESLQTQFSWNLTLDHHKFGEMFIVCGVLYAIDSVTDRITQIRIAVDLYAGKLFPVDLTFTNPFRRTTTVGYNRHMGELYSWDKGNQLTYPIRYNEKPIEDDSSNMNRNDDYLKK